MSHLTLIRHGQANSLARDEAGYDRLSPLGHRQAGWLGAHFDASGEVFARAYCGTLRRHVETARGIGAREVVQDARLNELEYFALATLLEQQHGHAIPQDREGFLDHLPLLFRYWQEGRIDNPPESFAVFETRVTDVLHDIAAGAGRALVVTSGGLISMALRLVMGLDTRNMARAALAIENSSVHRFQMLGGALALIQFNAVPHLEDPQRQFARTHI